ncbi:MAG: CsbD family protein, partial [Geobacteraceae bacterium]
MNWNQAKGNWNQFMGNAKAKWGDLTNDELTQIAGERDALVGLIQTKCLFHANWTTIPAQAGHPFHANLDSRSEATRGVDAV